MVSPAPDKVNLVRPFLPTMLWAILIAASLVIRSWGGLDIVRGDDARMLTTALLDSDWSFFLPYAGYLQIAPRATIQILSYLPLSLFPLFVFLISSVIWIINIALFARAIIVVTNSRLLGMGLGLITALMPPSGIEILAYLDHMQVPMLLGIISTVFSRKYFRTKILNVLFLFYIALYALSSPSAILVISTILILPFIQGIERRKISAFEALILAISLTGFLVQLGVTVTQHERVADLSFQHLLEGLKFGAYSIAPQPIRDHYYTGIEHIDFVWLLTCVIVLGVFLYTLCRQLFFTGAISANVACAAIALGALIFFTTISGSFHNGYLVIPTSFLIFSVAMTISELRTRGRNIVTAFALFFIILTITQSFVPKDPDDIFFGGSGHIYRAKIPWSDAITQAKRQSRIEVQREFILVETDSSDPFWSVTIPCRRLR